MAAPRAMAGLLALVLVCAGLGAGSLVGLGCASAPLAGPIEIWPIGPDGQPRPPDGPVVWTQPGVAIEIEPLSASQREAWLRAHAEASSDPLAAAGGGEMITFRVRLTASGNLPVHLESQSVRLMSDRGGASHAPLDYTRAFELLRPDRDTGPAAGDVERLMRGLLDGPIDVAPGRAREGLLVFPGPPADARMLVLELPFVQVGAETHRTRVPFARVAAPGPNKPVSGR